MDIISNLPDEILDLILERLPLIDRIRTSALSSIWSLRWTRNPSLIVDELFFDSVYNNDEGFANERSFLEYAKILKSVVLQHRGCLRDFSLFVPNFSSRSRSSWSIYQDLICSVIVNSNSSLERLILKRVDEELVKDDMVLPSSIFSLPNLRHLDIKWFELQPPSSFEGFPNLAHFSLVSGTVPTYTLSQFVSVCPQLETVCLKYPCGVYGNVYLPAPQLCHLQLRGCFSDIFVSNAQNMVSVSFISKCQVQHGKKESITNDTFRFLGSATQLKHITLNGEFCKMLGRSTLIPKYGLMRSLELQVIALEQVDQLKCVLSLLTASPKLRSLKLGMIIVPPNSEDCLLCESMIDMQHINADFECLVRVDLSGITGTKIQFKMIELLLCCSPILETMHIKFCAKEELKFQEVITKFHRASTKAKLQVINTPSSRKWSSVYRQYVEF